MKNACRLHHATVAEMLQSRCLTITHTDASVMFLDTPGDEVAGWYVVRKAHTDQCSIERGPYQHEADALRQITPPGWYVIRDAQTEHPSVKGGPYQTQGSAERAALREYYPTKIDVNILAAARGLRGQPRRWGF